MDKTRLQFDFTPEQVEQLDALVERRDAASRAEVIRRAVALYARLYEEDAQGREILVRQGEGYTRLMPTWNRP